MSEEKLQLLFFCYVFDFSKLCAVERLEYFPIVFSGLKDLLREEMELSNRIAVVIIAKSKDSLHEVLSSATGWHFISESIVLLPPDAEKRADIIRVLADKVGCCLTEEFDAR